MAVYLSLGSNMGNSLATLGRALEALGDPGIGHVTKVSSWYRTEPIGNVRQPVFVNAAAEVETAIEPLELLRVIKDIEARLGRVPTARWGPRFIDIDIILWDGRIVCENELRVPHPEFRRRAFVLIPLREIAPDVRDPETGSTIRDLASSPDAVGGVTRLLV